MLCGKCIRLNKSQGRIQDLWKGVHVYKWVRVASLIFLISLKYPLRPNYSIFMGYLKTGGGGGAPEPPLDPMIVSKFS